MILLRDASVRRGLDFSPQFRVNRFPRERVPWNYILRARIRVYARLRSIPTDTRPSSWMRALRFHAGFFYPSCPRESPRIKPCRNCGSRLDPVFYFFFSLSAPFSLFLLFFGDDAGGWNRGEPPADDKTQRRIGGIFFCARAK